MDMKERYLQFVEDRHDAWSMRYFGMPAPWSTDPIIAKAKFTNVYRVLDHGSQYLLRELLLPSTSPDEALMRAFLYRFTNRVEPWEYFRRKNERMPTIEDLVSGFLYEEWDTYRREGGAIFHTAYRILPEPGRVGADKLEGALRLARMTVQRSYPWAAPAEAQLLHLQETPGVGRFMGMQILADIQYTDWVPHCYEDEFVVPGPGCIKGAKEIGMQPDEAIQWSYELHAERRNVLLDGLPPSMMDIQNTFCEFSKYARYLRGGAFRSYTPRGTDHSDYVLPTRWRQQRAAK